MTAIVSRVYAGIGSRETPANVLGYMRSCAAQLERLGYTLRSGGASGADTAFANGCKSKTIYRADDATPAAIKTVARFHPAPHLLTPFVTRLHARNAMILLGHDLNDPVQFVLCWTPGGRVTGGTGQGLRIALHHKIPIVNMATPGWQSLLTSLVHPSSI